MHGSIVLREVREEAVQTDCFGSEVNLVPAFVVNLFNSSPSTTPSPGGQTARYKGLLRIKKESATTTDGEANSLLATAGAAGAEVTM